MLRKILTRTAFALFLATLFAAPAFADSLTATLRATIEATLSGTNDFGTPTYRHPTAGNITLESGTASGQSDILWADQRTLAASGSETLDLAGSLVTPIGTSAVFAEVTAILVRAASGNTNSVLVSENASNGFDGPFTGADEPVAVQPGGVAMFVAPAAGWTVTASSGDLLAIANSAGSTTVTYDIVILGRSS